ncbi:hypothetical protein ACTFIT_008809 [Dictyostelium discoideum]
MRKKKKKEIIQLLISCENEKDKNQMVSEFKRKGYNTIDPIVNENVKIIYGTSGQVNIEDISGLLEFNDDSNIFVFGVCYTKFFMGFLLIDEKEYRGNLKDLIGSNLGDSIRVN